MISFKLLPLLLPKGKYFTVNTIKMDLRQIQTLPWCKPEWPYPSMSKETNELLKQCTNEPIKQISQDVEETIKKSKAFPIPFPIESVRLEKLKVRRPIEKLHKNIVSTYPVIHERVLLLMTHFIIYKREFGSTIEKALYKDMTISDLVERILTKRAVTFMGPSDKYLLLSGVEGTNGWDAVGTIHQKPPLVLEDCLSYDEMKISSLIYVSGYTECINDGDRNNKGVVNEDLAESDAIIIGLIGPRFERKAKMEYEDVIISKSQSSSDDGLIGPRFKRKRRMDYEDVILTEHQNSPENGYGEEVTPTTCLNVLKNTYVRNNQSAKHMWRQMWSEFYQVHSYTFNDFTTYNHIQQKPDNERYLDRYVKINDDEIFDNEVYYKRIRVMIEVALLESNSRAKDRKMTAYLNIIGCGLGVWRVSTHQNDVYVLTILERIKSYLKRDMINHISDINFSYIKPSSGVLDLFKTENQSSNRIFIESKRHPLGGISVTLENRQPTAKLSPPHVGKLLLVTYPWDGNAHPGNEFWLGSLNGSGDPAAGCSTQVAELHNAYINPWVSGGNTRVAGRMGVDKMSAYADVVSDL